uniref:Uncharacterized protein n=1 Tax=Apteryx owenii TaxID=8824 RepID=A0A8B9Q5C9_APTOW
MAAPAASGVQAGGGGGSRLPLSSPGAPRGRRQAPAWAALRPRLCSGDLPVARALPGSWPPPAPRVRSAARGVP